MEAKWIGAMFVASVAALVASAAVGAYLVNTAVAGGVAVALTWQALAGNRQARERGLSVPAIGAANARHMATVWGWGAAAVAAIYSSVLSWPEWWQFVLAFVAAGLCCLIVAAAFGRIGRRAGDSDASAGFYKVARALTITQFVGMIAAMAGLLIDGKMDFGYVDWAANNVFFAGAAALAVMSWTALASFRPNAGPT